MHASAPQQQTRELPLPCNTPRLPVAAKMNFLPPACVGTQLRLMTWSQAAGHAHGTVPAGE